MLEYLDAIDKVLFLLINSGSSNPVTDLLMPWITSDHLLRLGYGMSMVALLIWGDKRLRWLVLVSLLVLAITDQTSSQLLKKIIERPRPCHVMENINLLVGCGGGFSMPSSHAANAWAQAVLFAIVTPRSRWFLLVTATLIALSRVFVGVHYPFDIVVGAIVGGSIGLLVALAFKRFYDDRLGLSVPSQAIKIKQSGENDGI